MLKSSINYNQWIISLYELNCFLTISLLSLLMIFLYWLFFVPLNWNKRLDDVSNSQIRNGKGNLRSSSKQIAMSRLRKTRAVASKELPPPYPNGWYGILESSKLKDAEALYVACLGQHFVIYRSQKSKVFILDAYCPHLGANMGLGGRVVGDNIECPFHQWSFRGTDGVCTSIPYSLCAPPSIRVKKWISIEMHGFIFVWYCVEELEQPWSLPKSDEVQTNKMVYHGRNEFYVNCHIQEIPENGADLAHFTAIHNKSFLAGGCDPKDNFLSNLGYHEWQASWCPSEEKHIAEVKLSHSFLLLNKFHCFRMKVIGKQLGPAYVHLFLHCPIIGNLQIFQTITPVEPLLQKVVHRFYASRSTAPIMKILICGESIMFERDMSIWNHKMYRSNPLLVLEDSSLKKFRKWYSNFYSANSKSYHQLDCMRW